VTIDTPAIRALTDLGVAFTPVQTSRPHSAQESAELQGIELGQLLRTIVIRRGADDYVFVLVPGGRQIDWPKIRSHLGVKRLSLPDADEARAATAWPVIADATVAVPDLVAIGGGAHGFNVHMTPDDVIRVTGATLVDVTKPDDQG
jgi:Cys-tRNA(Pro)/Cys-tRNA(Cys) deacylase